MCQLTNFSVWNIGKNCMRSVRHGTCQEIQYFLGLQNNKTLVDNDTFSPVSLLPLNFSHIRLPLAPAVPWSPLP